MLCAAAMGIFSAGAVTPMWLRDVKISPDGSTIAFTYKGDIYTVPAEGGNATRLTTSGSYEAVPVWSPDGSKIAFASDHHGSTDVFCDAGDRRYGQETDLIQRRGDSGSVFGRRQICLFFRRHTGSGRKRGLPVIATYRAVSGTGRRWRCDQSAVHTRPDAERLARRIVHALPG